MTFALFALVIASVTLNAVAQVLLRKAMLGAAPLPSLDTLGQLAVHLAGNLHLWGGLVCFAGSVLLWLGVLSRLPVSVAYPMASLGYIVAAVGGAAFLGEAITLWRAAGLALICAGVFVVAQST